MTIKLKSGVTITSALGKALDIIRTASMAIILATALEVDLGDAAVSLGDIYQFLREMDIISGLQGIMRLAEIRFLGARVKGHIR